MNTKQLLTLTLLTTVLTLNAALPKEYITTYRQQANSLSLALADLLYKRGIEKDKAMEISNEFTTQNEELFTLMLNNFIHHSEVNKERLLEKLSYVALQRKSIDLSSYATLVQLTQKLQSSALGKEQLQTLELIAAKNSTLKKVFA